MYIRRHCYDKPHRCPGWAGGGWRYPRQGRERCPSGHLDIDYDHRTRDAWRWHRCDRCDVRAIPQVVQWLDPTWWRWWLGYRADTVRDWWERRHW